MPSWRFFAPLPGVHDFHVMYRVTEAGVVSQWRGIDLGSRRKVQQLVWFPDRRREKAVFDVAAEIIHAVSMGIDVATRTVAYTLLDGYVAKRVRVDNVSGRISGYQIALAKSAGYESGHDPEMLLVSPFTPLVRQA